MITGWISSCVNMHVFGEGARWTEQMNTALRNRVERSLYERAERKSRVTLAARLAGKTAAETISVMLAVFARIEPALRIHHFRQ